MTQQGTLPDSMYTVVPIFEILLVTLLALMYVCVCASFYKFYWRRRELFIICQTKKFEGKQLRLILSSTPFSPSLNSFVLLLLLRISNTFLRCILISPRSNSPDATCWTTLSVAPPRRTHWLRCGKKENLSHARANNNKLCVVHNTCAFHQWV